MSRLKLEMGLNDMLFALGEGNPGAITVMMDSIKENKSIDPDNWAGPLGMILNLDMCGVYGSRIWGLYKRVCGERLPQTAAVLRAVQLGIIARMELDGAIDETMKLDVDKVCRKVAEELPNFKFD